MTDPILSKTPDRVEFIGTNDPLALASLILAELEHPGRTIIELCSEPQPYQPRAISRGEALAVARKACLTLLHGEPLPATFDRTDLAQAITILGSMRASLAVGAGVWGE